jgi:uncharacterized protein
MNRSDGKVALLDRQRILDLIRPHLEAWKRQFHVKSIGLFGSCARGDQRETSDVDLLVDFEKPIGIEFVTLAESLERLLKAKVDLVSRNGIKPRYLVEIEKEVIYA